VSKLTIGDAAHNGSIVVHQELRSAQNLALVSTGSVEVSQSGSLKAGERIDIAGSNVDIQGAIQATNGTRGGAITIVADAINVGSAATLDAKGETAGGTIQIGGSWQNSNPSVRQATTTTIASGAVVDASATRLGDGGTIVAWSDITKANSVTTVSGHAARQRRGGRRCRRPHRNLRLRPQGG